MSKHKKKKHGKDSTKKKKKMLPAKIEEAEWVGDRFRLVHILAKGCRGVKWWPGAKLKIEIGEDNTRTYTPITIEPKSGRVRILMYTHGQSPASQWASAIAAGDKTYCSVPRPSFRFERARLSSSLFWR
jgi:ferric-chelate reductase (NADPH)